MPLEYALLSLIYNAIKDFFRWGKSKNKMTPEQIIHARQKWKDEIEKHLGSLHNDQHVEIIVRDSVNNSV